MKKMTSLGDTYMFDVMVFLNTIRVGMSCLESQIICRNAHAYYLRVNASLVVIVLS